jgi:galactose mutarotase-like enzyme
MTASISQVKGPGGLALLRLEHEDTVAEVCPERGALVTRLAVGGDELLYLDEETLADRTRNVRGGVPLLFPFGGRLPGDAYAVGAESHQLKQHGFGRNRPFAEIGREVGASGVRVTYRLTDDPETLAGYPFPFALELTYTLQPGWLALDARIENRGARPVPHALGWHPYFRVAAGAKGQARLETDATRALDNQAGQEVEYGPPDFDAGEIDLHLLDHTLPGTLLSRPPLRPIRLDWDDAFETLVLWTLPGRPFVCVEPWTSPAAAFARGEARAVAPGAVEVRRFAISV